MMPELALVLTLKHRESKSLLPTLCCKVWTRSPIGKYCETCIQTRNELAQATRKERKERKRKKKYNPLKFLLWANPPSHMARNPENPATARASGSLIVHMF